MIKDNLQRLRKSRGMTQSELAEAIGTSFVQVSRWETGAAAPNSEWISKLTKALDVSSDELISGSDNDRWEITIVQGTEEVIDMTQSMPSVGQILTTPNGAALTISAKWGVFENDDEFETFIEKLRATRPLVLQFRGSVYGGGRA